MKVARRGTYWTVSLCLSLVCSACGTTASFIQSDQSFRARQGAAPPKIVDKAPEPGFAPVGVIEVQGPVLAPKEDFIKAAVSEGEKLGCDVLAHQALYEQRRGIDRRRRPNGVATWLLTCEVSDPTRSTAGSAKLADATVQRIVEAEFGEPVCEDVDPTGSHIPSTICRLSGRYRNWSDGTTWAPDVRWPP